MNEREYDYVIVGAGIAGCSTAYFLSKYSKNILLIDRNSDVALGASGAAGAFLSPLLGKPNNFKNLICESLKFSTDFYLENIYDEITNCGVIRIPKTKEDEEKFKSYIPYMDFPYKKEGEGYFFKIGSQVNSYNICKFLSSNIKNKFNYEIEKIKKIDNIWIINDELKTKNIILTTGADIKLVNEEYFNIRAVWGQKIDILTTSKSSVNYHKACSLSHSIYIEEKAKNLISIGATHNRVDVNLNFSNANLKNKEHEYFNLNLIDKDTQKLIDLANDIKELKNVEVVDVKLGARASSIDYFPILGKLVDSKKTLEKYPHLVNGSFIKDDMLSYHDNLFVLNGVGGRGYVLSPYLAKILVENIINNKKIDANITTNRLFTRWVKKNG